MNFSLKYIRTDELLDYVNSQEYDKQSFVPISKLRALSHANNPRARPEDIALILAFDKEKLIGYLGSIPEYLFIDEKRIPVCWLSCMWVLPEYRRAGIASRLLADAYKIYRTYIFITNYIPRSKAAFFKTGYFREIKTLPGVRAYFRSDLLYLLSRRYSKLKVLRPLLWLADTMINAGNSVKNFFLLRHLKIAYSYEQLETINETAGSFIREAMKGTPFRRSQEEFEWMMKYPWVSNVREDQIDYKKYYFSQYSPDFKQWFIHIRSKSGETVGFMMLTRHKHEIKTPYLIGKKAIYEDIFRYLCRFMIDNKIYTLVTHNNNLVEQISKHTKFFLLIRPKEYGFIATPEIAKLMNNDPGKFFDGDGDGAFT
jgi:GNAT superfamily N-acetyltransferase